MQFLRTSTTSGSNGSGYGLGGISAGCSGGGGVAAIDWPAFVNCVDLLLPDRAATVHVPVWQALAPDPARAAELTELRREELLSCM